MGNNFKHSNRIWLEPNNTDTDSYVNFYVSVDGARHSHAQLKIADCNRAIELYFDVDQDGIRKINRLINHLSEFRDTLKEGIKRREKAENTKP